MKFNFYLNYLIFLFIIPSISAQSDYLMTIQNERHIDDFTFEFDIFIESTLDNFLLTSYQCIFNFNWTRIAEKEDTIDFIYLEGSSELSNPPSTGIGVNFIDGIKELTFASYPGSDLITREKVKVGSFQIVSPKNFIDKNPDPNWNFEGKLFTLITGSNFNNITESSAHVKNRLTDNKQNLTVTDFKLNQNYPNPFNPSTTIEFSLGEKSYTKLSIFNITGEFIKDLVNEELESGFHAVKFDAFDLPSGVYIYSLTSDSFQQVKKMILLK